MKKENLKTMRDVFIENICTRMAVDKKVFFLSADFGSPALDRLRKKFKNRFINVGIAEQNLINVATGLALEGFRVYAYAIASFLTMRAFEQIRNNLSLLSQFKALNVNLIGVGAGLSYDVSGPTHHCLEDISIMMSLPNLMVLSPSDWVLAGKLVDYTLKINRPKYLRLDGKPLARIYQPGIPVSLKQGFCHFKKGSDICLVSTGYMTHKAQRIAFMLAKEGINTGIIDVFRLKPFEKKIFFEAVKNYKYIFTLEEAFIKKGGLDSLIFNILSEKESTIKIKSIGFDDSYSFEVGSRQYLHRLLNLDEDSLLEKIKSDFKSLP